MALEGTCAVFKFNFFANFLQMAREKIVDIEKQISTLKNKKSVIALGGGGFINNKIREDILSNHFSFWLDWDESILLKRIKDKVSVHNYKIEGNIIL